MFDTTKAQAIVDAVRARVSHDDAAIVLACATGATLGEAKRAVAKLACRFMQTEIEQDATLRLAPNREAEQLLATWSTAWDLAPPVKAAGILPYLKALRRLLARDGYEDASAIVLGHSRSEWHRENGHSHPKIAAKIENRDRFLALGRATRTAAVVGVVDPVSADVGPSWVHSVHRAAVARALPMETIEQRAIAYAFVADEVAQHLRRDGHDRDAGGTYDDHRRRTLRLGDEARARMRALESSTTTGGQVPG